MRYHFFFNDTATTEIYTLSLHDALPISCDGFIRIGTDLPALRNETMTEEEVEVVAEELAKIGGIAWYPGREEGTLMRAVRSEEHTSELQSRQYLVCRLLLEKK